MSGALSATGAGDASQLGPSPTTSRRSGPPVGASVADIAGARAFPPAGASAAEWEAWMDGVIYRPCGPVCVVTVMNGAGVRMPWERGFFIRYLAKRCAAERPRVEWSAEAPAVGIHVGGNEHWIRTQTGAAGDVAKEDGALGGLTPAADVTPSAAPVREAPAGHTLQALLAGRAPTQDRRQETPVQTSWQRTAGLYRE